MNRPLANPEAKLSPLDQIRHVEADITRQIAVAREAAEKTVAQERTQAARLKKEAQEAGRREGQNRYKDLIGEAERETRVLVAQAHQRAEDLRQRGQRQMAKAIHHAVKIILGDIEIPRMSKGETKEIRR